MMRALRRVRLPLPEVPAKHAGPPRRFLHLAPPFLLDDHIPRYATLSPIDASLKRSRAYAHLCGVNRYETTGMCLIGDKAKVNVIAPHFGEGELSALSSPLDGIPRHSSWRPFLLFTSTASCDAFQNVD
jgi:hypothetical protein